MQVSRHVHLFCLHKTACCLADVLLPPKLVVCLQGVPRDCVRAVKRSLDQSAFREPEEQTSENPL